MPERVSTSHAPRATSPRVWKQVSPYDTYVYFYGVDGNLLVTCGDGDDYGFNAYFGSKQIWSELVGQWGAPVSQDRLGSVVYRNAVAAKYFPYGEEAVSTPSDHTKYATYYRDQITALDYARNRYYSTTIARFTSPDPYRASGGPASPQSWNRYSYVHNDPINFNDPRGLEDVSVTEGWFPPEILGPWAWSPISSKNPGAQYMELLPELGGGGGGASAPTLVTVKNLSKTGNNQTFIENTFRWISAALAEDPDCSAWLKGAQSYIQDLLNNSLVAHGEFNTGYTAFTGTKGTDVPVGYAAVVVNDLSAFFNGGFSVANGTINGNTDLARVFILLHELGHGLEIKDYQNDMGDTDAGERNDAKVLKNCGKTLDRLR